MRYDHAVPVLSGLEADQLWTYERATTQSLTVDQLEEGQLVAIACTVEGETVTGPFGSTNIWDYVLNPKTLRASWISDAYLFADQAEPVGPQCGGAENHYDSPKWLPESSRWLLEGKWEAPGILQLYEEISRNEAWNPGLENRKWSIYRNDAGAQLHGEGRALDYRMDAEDNGELEAGNALAAYLQIHAEEYGVQEIIWNGKAWDMDWAAAHPTDPYVWDEGYASRLCGPPPDPTDPSYPSYKTCAHMDHLHIGMNWAGALLNLPYSNGRG